MNARRGYEPEDDSNFSSEAVEILRKASRHVTYLINEGYNLKRAVTFVGDRYLLSKRQRLALMRSVATEEQLKKRRYKLVPARDLSGREVWIDGFNMIITLEVILNQSPVFLCMDGTIRDLAALRGTYRIIPETENASRVLYDMMQEAGASKLNILLDEPVSNSGRLKTLLAEVGEEYFPELDIQIIKDVDKVLYEKELVISSDSIILDNCRSWANPTAEYMTRRSLAGIKVW
ncbi:MAG: DUF434 domain-containing protein [Lachnospiraceae bacterium]|nr:DUF434 domain-containing protein [Lachnospiraceae bacterium]